MDLRPAIACVSLLVPTLAGQESPKRPSTGGFNTAVGLGGGAGGLYGMRGGGLRSLAARDEAGAAQLDALLTQLGERQPWREDDGDPGVDQIEAAAWALLALGANSTMRSGPHKAATKSVAADLRELIDSEGRLALPTGSDLRLHALVTWALAEVAKVSSYRPLAAQVRGLAERLVDRQLDDGALPADAGSDAGDPTTTALVMHVWRTVEQGRSADETGTAAALQQASSWLAAEAEDVEVAAVLWAEQQLLSRSLDAGQIEGLAERLPVVEDATWESWATRPELRFAWLTIAQAQSGEAWSTAWARARSAALACEPAEASVAEVAGAALTLSAGHRYVTRR